MYCMDCAETRQPDNLVSFMLHELIFLGCDSQFASHAYLFASYLYGCKILQPNVAARALRCGILLHSVTTE